MIQPMNSGEFQACTEQIERLVQRAAEIQDEGARTTALELVQSLMDLHGAAMSRIVEVLTAAGEAGRTSLAKLGSDPLICGLLVLYEVHPVSLQDRITSAVEKLTPQLRKQGGSVELISVADATVRLKVQGAEHGCGSSPEALKRTVEQAILEAAPELSEIIIDGVPAAASGFVPLNMIQPATKEEKNYEESAA